MLELVEGRPPIGDVRRSHILGAFGGRGGQHGRGHPGQTLYLDVVYGHFRAVVDRWQVGVDESLGGRWSRAGGHGALVGFVGFVNAVVPSHHQCALTPHERSLPELDASLSHARHVLGTVNRLVVQIKHHVIDDLVVLRAAIRPALAIEFGDETSD